MERGQLSPQLITHFSAHHWWLHSVLFLFSPSVNIYWAPTVYWAKKMELDHSFPTDGSTIHVILVCFSQPFCVSSWGCLRPSLNLIPPPGGVEERDDGVHLCTLLRTPARGTWALILTAQLWANASLLRGSMSPSVKREPEQCWTPLWDKLT